jgi:hypothetical protein
MPLLLKLLPLIFFLSLPGFAQEGKVIIRETPVTETEVDEQPMAIDEIDAMELAELEKKKAEQMKKMQMVERSAEIIAKPITDNPAMQLLELTKGQITAASLMDDRVQAALSRIFSEGYMKSGSREQTMQMLRDKVKGSFGEKLFNMFPSLLEISTDVLRDTMAMPGLLKILKRKKDLKTFGYIWLVIFIFGIFIKGRIVKPKWSFLKRRLVSMLISLPMTVVSVWLFYSFFGEEIQPTLTIIAKHWF